MDAQGGLVVKKSAGGAHIESARKPAPTNADGDRQARGALAKPTTPEEYEKLFSKEGIDMLVNRLREEGDPTVKGYIRAAIRNHGAKMTFTIKCKNSHSWSDPDNVSLLVNGAPGGTTTLTTGQENDVSIAFKLAYADLATSASSLPAANVNVRAHSFMNHDHPFTLDPLRDVTDFVAIDSRYEYKYVLENRGGEAGAVADAKRNPGAPRP